MNNIIYEKKYNNYKKSDVSNKNNKMIKYLNKLNISGGAGFRQMDMTKYDDLNILGKGSFGVVKEFTEEFKDYAIKQFTNNQRGINDYNDEKNLYIKKLSIYCGKIQENSYIYNDHIIPLTNNNYIFINTDEFVIIIIKSNILAFIKENIIPQELKDNIIEIIMYTSKPLQSLSLNIYGRFADQSVKMIGTFLYTSDTESTLIYIDSFKTMRLLYFNDTNRLLFYKNLGISLTDAFKKLEEPNTLQKVLLCMDLIKQVNGLIETGIYHNDLKTDNIVIKKCRDGNYYLTIIDYGLAILHSELNLLGTELLTTGIIYSPEYNKINKILKKKKEDINLKILEELLDKSSHWVLGGICINILNWKDIQLSEWSKSYGTLYKTNISFLQVLDLDNNENYDNAIHYIDSLKAFIPEYESIPEYDILKSVIINLLEPGTDMKKLLSVHYAKFKDSKYYNKYLSERLISEIDN